jgi:hypothetical protein
MYAILVKNDDESYDVVSIYNHKDTDIINGIEAALALGHPVIAMEASEHKLTATHGSTWNGTSFSGGKPSRASEATQEQLDSFNLYVFLSNNVLIARHGLPVGSNKTELFNAAFNGEVVFAKVPEDQSVSEGETVGWDGSRFI